MDIQFYHNCSTNANNIAVVWKLGHKCYHSMVVICSEAIYFTLYRFIVQFGFFSVAFNDKDEFQCQSQNSSLRDKQTIVNCISESSQTLLTMAAIINNGNENVGHNKRLRKLFDVIETNALRNPTHCSQNNYDQSAVQLNYEDNFTLSLN